MASMQNNIVFGGAVSPSDSNLFGSLGAYIIHRFKINPDAVMMIDALTGHQYTRKVVLDKVIRLAYVLNHLGVKKGDVIGLCSENSIEYAVTLFATFVVGAIAVPFNTTYSDRELDHGVNLTKPKIFFCSSGPLSKIVKVANKHKSIEQVIIFRGKTTEAVVSFEKLMNASNIVSQNDFESPRSDKANDVVLIAFSSGTTGIPKGVQITHTNILCFINPQLDSSRFQINRFTVLSVVPWFHAFGCITMVISLCMENTMVFLPKFNEKIFLGAIEKFKVELAFMVPPLMVFLAKDPIVDKYNLSSLICLLCGTAPLGKETEDAIKKRIGVQAIHQGYGLSEATVGVTSQNDTYCKPGSVGGLKPGVWAKIVDIETGENLGPNKRGELCIQGPVLMKGYIGDAASTSKIIKDGWLHTGDIGYYDDDLEFFIVDRIKELIKYKGYQVPPAEIEALLLTNKKIRDAAVIGKPDEAAGELPVAFVVKQPNVLLTEADVVKFVADNASPAKKLRGGVVFVKEIPKNPSGKILRRVLREMLEIPKSKL